MGGTCLEFISGSASKLEAGVCVWACGDDGDCHLAERQIQFPFTPGPAKVGAAAGAAGRAPEQERGHELSSGRVGCI